MQSGNFVMPVPAIVNRKKGWMLHRAVEDAELVEGSKELVGLMECHGEARSLKLEASESSYTCHPSKSVALKSVTGASWDLGELSTQFLRDPNSRLPLASE